MLSLISWMLDCEFYFNKKIIAELIFITVQLTQLSGIANDIYGIDYCFISTKWPRHPL
jgi:hypothetical protein